MIGQEGRAAFLSEVGLRVRVARMAGGCHKIGWPSSPECHV
jgi:hypothetical protein